MKQNSLIKLQQVDRCTIWTINLINIYYVSVLGTVPGTGDLNINEAGSQPSKDVLV